MSVSFPAIDPAAQIRDYRANYININTLSTTTAMPATMSLMSPSQQSLMNLNLPQALLDAMALFQKNNPDGRTLTAVKYMRITNGSPDIVVEDSSPLPAETDIVTFSHTVSALSINSASIVTHQLVATLASVTSGAIA
jgi:hypothetical protein